MAGFFNSIFAAKTQTELSKEVKQMIDQSDFLIRQVKSQMRSKGIYGNLTYRGQLDDCISLLNRDIEAIQKGNVKQENIESLAKHRISLMTCATNLIEHFEEEFAIQTSLRDQYLKEKELLEKNGEDAKALESVKSSQEYESSAGINNTVKPADSAKCVNTVKPVNIVNPANAAGSADSVNLVNPTISEHTANLANDEAYADCSSNLDAGELAIWEMLYKAAKSYQNAREISKHIYAGQVAAAVLSKKGNIFTGVCIDTACGLGVCAERNALFHMITEGESEFIKVLAIMPDGKTGAPCGACREFMAQLMPDGYKDVEIMLDYEQKKIVTLGSIMKDWWI